jgi:predicted nucleic acid-binding protein
MAMAEQIAIDSNVLVALIDSRDKWHVKANALLSTLKDRGLQPVYFDCVLNEAISVLARRAEEQRRSEELPALFGQLLTQVPREIILWISGETEHLYGEIIELVVSSSGRLNFHDALMVLACRELRIPFVASFDADFDNISWLTRLGGPVSR